MTQKKSYLFGPVPSRRLGLSLGVDIVPFKTCTLDCLYCQLGLTTEKTLKRADFVPIEDVIEQLKTKIADGLKADYITLSGSGEPTLHSRFGELIDKIKKITNIPVAVITNATLLNDRKVRNDCAKADLIVPSLDAPDQQTFEKINRPENNLNIDKIIQGLIQLREQYTGQIWLEIFLIDPINTEKQHIENFAKLIQQIHPDKVQLNTAVRPTAEKRIKKINLKKMNDIAKKLGSNCRVVADFAPRHPIKHIETKPEYVLSMLKRRPCSINDVSRGLSINKVDALNYLKKLIDKGLVETVKKNQTTFYKAL